MNSNTNDKLLILEQDLIHYLEENFSNDDKSHDLSHFKRVWKLGQKLAEKGDDLEVILVSAYLHDIVSYPKNHPDRSLSSKHAAIKAREILAKPKFQITFNKSKIDQVAHCIEAHSFSANIPALTQEAKIVQDADRMESLGAIGLARTFYVAARIGSQLFDPIDPLAKNRELDDTKYALDHFETKLLKLPDTMQTIKGKREARKRAQLMIDFKKRLISEL